MEEKRKIEQEPVYDEYGRIAYYKINNYKRKENFLTKYEKKYLITLMSIIKKINEKNENRNIVVFSQVALNTIVKFNNLRITQQSEEEIRNKSIDFVLYDTRNDEILCCIELNGEEHEESQERMNRDILLSQIFEDVKIKLIFEKNKNYYDEKEIIEKIKK